MVVGNGMVGSHFAQETARLDPEGARVHVTVVGSEPCPAYNRLLLSEVLAGRHTSRTIGLPRTEAEHIRVRTDTTATALDTRSRTLGLDDGTHLHFDELVLATGAHARLPPVPGLRTPNGGPGPGVSALRSVADCERILSLLAPGAPVIVLGGGVLGLEAARGLAGRGARVSVVEFSPWIMPQQIDRSAARILTRYYTDVGVQVYSGRAASRWVPGTGLELDDGRVLAGDALVVTAGVGATTDLAEQAGLEIDRGIVVDDRLTTSHPRVHAIGDCAQHPGGGAGLAQPGWEQASVLARRLTGTAPEATYTGARPVTRLKAQGIELTAFGQVHTGPEDQQETAETVTVNDPHGGRYARLTVEDERVVGAVLIGLPEAAAALTDFYDSGAPVPDDRLALAQGLSPATGAAREAPESDPLVCRCNAVRRTDIERAWLDGARDRVGVADRTRATTGCGGCVRQVQDLLGRMEQAAPAPAEVSADTDLTGLLQGRENLWRSG